MQMETSFKYIDENYKRIAYEIGEAKAKYRKPADEITFMAVTKTVAPEAVNHAIGCGIHVLGENRVQEYLSKKELYLPEAEVHMIGHLQTNKVKYIIEDMALIHSVDSLHLAQEIDRHAARVGKVQNILIEVNVGAESSKSGVSPEALWPLLDAAAAQEHIQVKGLMAIPPVNDDDAQNRRYLAAVHDLFVKAGERGYSNVEMQTLSMGMSGDYENAIREGATLVRIGTAIYGERDYSKK